MPHRKKRLAPTPRTAAVPAGDRAQSAVHHPSEGQPVLTIKIGFVALFMILFLYVPAASWAFSWWVDRLWGLWNSLTHACKYCGLHFAPWNWPCPRCWCKPCGHLLPRHFGGSCQDCVEQGAAKPCVARRPLVKTRLIPALWVLLVVLCPHPAAAALGTLDTEVVLLKFAD